MEGFFLLLFFFFLLPLIGELRLNLVHNPKRSPGANIRYEAQLMALTCLHTNRMIARAGGEEEGSIELKMGGEMFQCCSTES